MYSETFIILVLMCLLMISCVAGVILYYNYYQYKPLKLPRIDDQDVTYQDCPICPKCPKCRICPECPECPEYHNKPSQLNYISGRQIYLIGKFNKLLITKIEVYDINNNIVSKNKTISGSYSTIYGNITDVINGNLNNDIQFDNSRNIQNNNPIYLEIDLGASVHISKIIIYTKDNVNKNVCVSEIGIKDGTNVVFSSNNINIPSRMYIFDAPFLNNNEPMYDNHIYSPVP